jgi:hypothetical protein
MCHFSDSVNKSCSGSSLISNFLGLISFFQELLPQLQIRVRWFISNPYFKNTVRSIYFLHYPSVPPPGLSSIIGLHGVKICMALPVLNLIIRWQIVLRVFNICTHGNCVYIAIDLVVRNKGVRSRLSCQRIMQCISWMQMIDISFNIPIS